MYRTHFCVHEVERKRARYWSSLCPAWASIFPVCIVTQKATRNWDLTLSNPNWDCCVPIAQFIVQERFLNNTKYRAFTMAGAVDGREFLRNNRNIQICRSRRIQFSIRCAIQRFVLKWQQLSHLLHLAASPIHCSRTSKFYRIYAFNIQWICNCWVQQEWLDILECGNVRACICLNTKFDAWATQYEKTLSLLCPNCTRSCKNNTENRVVDDDDSSIHLIHS